MDEKLDPSGIMKEIDFYDLESVGEKYNLTPRQTYEIFIEVNFRSKQYKIANAPLEHLKSMHKDLGAFLEEYNFPKEESGAASNGMISTE